MPNHHPNRSPRGSLNLLLAEARRDDLLREAAQARLASHAPRARGGRLRALARVALARATHAHAAKGPSAPPGDSDRAAETERDVPAGACTPS